MKYSHVLYHGGCNDGFGAAFASWMVLGDSAQYLAVSHGDELPELPKDADVLMLDIAFKRERHLELCSKVKSVTVVDHHASAHKEIGGLPGVHFDLSRSGAVLAWQHFFPTYEIPQLLLYVEDRDLWKFKLPWSKEINAAISSYDRTFTAWGELHHWRGADDLYREGTGILRFINQQVARACEHAFMRRVGAYEVPVVCATAFGSEICNKLLEMHPEAPFSATFYETKTSTKWGLRSRPGFDCSAVAKEFGGGGHPQSSGFEVKHAEVRV